MTEKELNKNIGKRLKILRESHNMTQQEMSDRIGLSKNHISDLENGKSKISCAVLYAYATTFSESADVILGIGAPKILPELSGVISNNLDEDQQRKLLRLLYAYIGK